MDITGGAGQVQFAEPVVITTETEYELFNTSNAAYNGAVLDVGPLLPGDIMLILSTTLPDGIATGGAAYFR